MRVWSTCVQAGFALENQTNTRVNAVLQVSYLLTSDF